MSASSRILIPTVRSGYKLALQPVYAHPQLDLWGYEVLGRIMKSGKPRSPPQLLDRSKSREDWKNLDLAIVELCLNREDVIAIPENLSLNVSPTTLVDFTTRLRFIDRLKQLASLRAHARTILEFPEDLDMRVAELSILLEQLHNSGIQCAMDDYGKAHSGNSRLCAHPWDICKIDWTPHNRIRVSLKTIIEACMMMGIEAIVEGVETTQDLVYASSMAPQALQGFWLHKPYIPDGEQSPRRQRRRNGAATPAFQLKHGVNTVF